MKRIVGLLAVSTLIFNGTAAGAARVDGLITFVSDRSGDKAIYTVRPDGSGIKGPLAGVGDGSPAAPELSPDGSRIAFSQYTVTCLPQGAHCTVESKVWLVNSDGSNAMQLPTGPAEYAWSPSWSPDGKTIVYEGSNEATWGDLYTATETAPGEWTETKITERPGSEGLATFSPNGKFIAYAHYPDEDSIWTPVGDAHVGNTSEIYVMRADGTGRQRKVTDWPTSENTVPTWSPDSRKIAFLRYGEKPLGVWMVNRDGSGAKRLIAGAALRPSWSPNPRYIVFERCNMNLEPESCRIERFDRRTRRTKVVADAPVQYDGNPHWGGAGR